MFYSQAQSIQLRNERHFHYYNVVLHTVQHSPARTPNEALPVLMLYYNPAQSIHVRNEALPVLILYYNQAQTSLHPKQGTSSTNAIQPRPHNPACVRFEALPVLMLYYSPAQSSQDLQSSTIQPASETRHFQYLQYECFSAIKHNPARTQNKALPVLMHCNPAGNPNEALPVPKLYHNPSQSSLACVRFEALPVLMFYSQAQSSQDPKRGTSKTNVVLSQPASETRHFQY